MNAIPAALGIYSVQDAARLTGVPPRQIRGWLQGYAQRKGKAAAGPVLRRQHELRDGELALGFLDLLEVAFLGRLVRAAEAQGRAPSWKAIRTAAETARRVLNTDHPFAVRRIHTDGKRIFAEAQRATGDRALYDLVGDNFAIYDVVVDSFVASVEYEEDTPRRWTPDSRFDRIVVDPRRAFGRPVESTSGAPAEALFDAWRAEKGNAAKVAAYYGTDAAGVQQAVHFTLGADAPLPNAA
ncbi:MAG: hypothetical protein NZM07_01985 [Elioraea sp.]|nr:hypothetical protein [Elioraea sp.]